MTNETVSFHSLSRRIVAQFCLFTLVLSLLFSFLCFILLYNLEDKFIEREIEQEAKYLITEQQRIEQWPETRGAHFSIYYSTDEMPEDMRQQFIDEPQQIEFYGSQGRHYHLKMLSQQPTVYLVAEVSEQLLVRPVREGMIKLLLISGVSLTFIACIIAWQLGRKTARPLKQLADLVDGVAPENIPEIFAHQYPKNEIGILAQTLETTMGRMKQALSRERNFTRDVSHELRTPVAVIKNSLEVLALKTANSEDVQSIHNRIANASIQMEQTVTTLLLLAREEHTSSEKSAISLLPMVEQSVLDNSYLLNGKTVDVCVDDTCDTQVLAQSGMLKVLLDNLLSNAFQYTNSGQVKISYVEQQLVVKDTGPGIEREISDKITEPSVKGSQSTGYGFGLSIVKRLCEHQHWQLSVDSEAEGTTIAVLLD
ncbi:sensor histidine kinase [Thalassotalea atypica]|uniref:sensor histidine kinase n=1 Tax=Thalassotalea atypica TaxID=2054316 RepID=UPI0025738BB3|nr:HAMP domain-containing sensor histidine kinase [Thalassotalea atypica]